MTSKISSVHCTMLGTFTHLSKPCTVPTQPQVEMIKIVLTATLLLCSGCAAGGVSERLGHYIHTSLARCLHTGTCLTTPWHGTTLTQVAPSWLILGQGGSQGALYYPAGGSQGVYIYPDWSSCVTGTWDNHTLVTGQGEVVLS